ncbi:MAG: hypothetical protein ABIX12_09220, partial [Rubrivivax sp.]
MSADLRGEPTALPLQVVVINGDLTFVRSPLLLGHYRSLRLMGTERVMDRLVGGSMNASLEANVYPDAPGSHQVFVNTHIYPENPLQAPRPEAVIVVGLGEEGKLGAAALMHSVCQAVIGWAQRVVERKDAGASDIELAATLIGSGGSGISAGQSAQLIVRGVVEANTRLSGLGWAQVSALHLIELYLDRATEAWHALQTQGASTPDLFQIAATVQPGTGGLSRPPESGYRGADYDFISATSEAGSRGEAVIAYTVDTRRARSEVRAQATQARLVRQLVATASDDQLADERIGRSLFQLLVPVELEPFLSGTTEIVIELDSGTAGIPWELLDGIDRAARNDRRPESLPWAIRSKLLRKLLTAEFRAKTVDVSVEADALVIGEPAADRARYPRLPGARAEARAV